MQSQGQVACPLPLPLQEEESLHVPCAEKTEIQRETVSLVRMLELPASAFQT